MNTSSFSSRSVLLMVALAFGLGACDYSNQFTGTYNNAPATLSAYSKNIDKYCVALTLDSNGAKKSNFISAQAVFDPNDLLASKSFNTKGSQCAANQTEYLVGTRTATVLSTAPVTIIRNVGMYSCQAVYYTQYQYQEKISFELHTIANDQLVGTFEGTGQPDQYVDESHPTGYGAIYPCRGNGPYPYPYPYPRPYPGPRPHPHPGPYPHPHPRPFS